MPDLTTLLEEVKQVYSDFGGLPRGNTEELAMDLDHANAWLMRASEILAEAEALLNTKRGERAKVYREQNISATYLRELLTADCVPEQKLYTLTSRLISTLTHRIDSLRTLISFEKSALQLGGQ